MGIKEKGLFLPTEGVRKYGELDKRLKQGSDARGEMIRRNLELLRGGKPKRMGGKRRGR